jgi:hypothetical protein
MVAIVTATRQKLNPLSRHFRAGSVLTSSELISRLTAEGMSADAARQTIRRHAGRGEIWRSEELHLAKDERLFALASDIRTPGFFRAVGTKLLDTNRWGLARCLEALGSRQVLHKVDVMRMLAVSPNSSAGKRLARSRAYDAQLAGLREIGVTLVQQGTALESIVVPFRDDGASADELATRALAAVRNEALLARILVERLRRQNMFSWNRVELPDLEQPYTVFNDQIFSSYGFSYLSPLVRWRTDAKKPTPCPVLIDSYHGLCLLSHVHSFLQRIDRASNRGRSRMPCLGVIAARDFEHEAWVHARRQGFMTVSYRQMFGDEALDAMVLVERLLDDLWKGECLSDAKSNFEQFSRLLDDLKSNPVVATLRSIGFEALAGLVLRTQGYDDVELGRIVPWENTKRDVDVFGLGGKEDELRIIECKAYHGKKSLSADDVVKFFTETVPALKKRLREQGRGFSKCHAEIWTTGPLGREAREKRYSLNPPKAETWEMLSGNDVRNALPQLLRRRGAELIDAIAMEATQGTEGEES